MAVSEKCRDQRIDSQYTKIDVYRNPRKGILKLLLSYKDYIGMHANYIEMWIYTEI